MANDLNKVMIIGRLGQDPEMRYLQNGNAVVNISVATGSSWKDKNTGEKQERTEWHRCTAYRQLAEIVGKYLHKGSKVYIEGRLQTRKWKDQSGSDRYTTEIQVDQMQMLDSKPQGNGQNYQPAQQNPPQQTGRHNPQGGQHNPQGGQQQGGQQDFDDDIPF